MITTLNILKIKTKHVLENIFKGSKSGMVIEKVDININPKLKPVD
jgi:hypothetical protein